MLAKHKPQSLDLDNLELEETTPLETTSQEATTLETTSSDWFVSQEALSKAHVAKKKEVSKGNISTDYLTLCKMLKLKAKRFHIFEVEDKQKLNLLSKQFDTWIIDSNENLEHMIPSVLFWQQFDFASVSPSNFNVDGITKKTNTFKEMPLFKPKNIFYFKGGDLGHLLFNDDEKNLNIYTGNDKKFQFHLVKAELHPVFVKFLESK